LAAGNSGFMPKWLGTIGSNELQNYKLNMDDDYEWGIWKLYIL